MSASSNTVFVGSLRQFVIRIVSLQKTRFVLGWRTEGATMALETKFHRRLNLELLTWRVAAFDGLHSAERMFLEGFNHVLLT